MNSCWLHDSATYTFTFSLFWEGKENIIDWILLRYCVFSVFCNWPQNLLVFNVSPYLKPWQDLTNILTLFSPQRVVPKIIIRPGTMLINLENAKSPDLIVKSKTQWNGVNLIDHWDLLSTRHNLDLTRFEIEHVNISTNDATLKALKLEVLYQTPGTQSTNSLALYLTLYSVSKSSPIYQTYKMLLLFALLISATEGNMADIFGYRKCTKVNGISGACNLRLNYFTLAGNVETYCVSWNNINDSWLN